MDDVTTSFPGGAGKQEPATRKEDERLLTGRGRYVADHRFPDEAHAFVLRSPHAHAWIRSIDTAVAERAAGVVAVLTGEDPDIASLGRIPWEVPPPGWAAGEPGAAAFEAPLQPILPRSLVRYVGEPVAMIVAATPAAARDAAELVEIDYEALPAVTEARHALGPGAPQLWPECAENTYFRFVKGDAAAVAAAFESAAAVVEIEIANNRLAANPMEPRGYLGLYDDAAERYELHAAASKPHLLQRMIAGAVLDIDRQRLRVVARDVGGGFGAKNHVYPEQVLVLVAAKRLRRPVRWIAERAEMLVSDAQGRDQHSRAALAVDRDGKFLAIRVSSVANLGAYLSPRGVVSPLAGGRTLPGAYAIPAAFLEVACVFTNTVPTAPYRGAGQPEIMFILERLVDCAARELGIGPAELRRRNLVPADAFPYRNALGTVYDTGEFEANLDRAMALSRWEEFPQRREEARRRGRLRGIGMSYTIEACGFGIDEEASIALDSAGAATVLIGTMSNGQGHETAYARLVSQRLGIPESAVTVVQGDTDLVPNGNGTGASRSMTVGGSALFRACEALVGKALPIAVRLLQSDPAKVAFAAGRFRVVDGHGEVGWWDVAAAACDPRVAAETAATGLVASARFAPGNYTFPNGCHVCELEVDPETGKVDLFGYCMVHDVGRAISRVIVEGQLQGGVAQGMGQALLERVAYDPETGQVVSGSFLDYAMPRADDLPDCGVELNEVLSTVNPLGARSCGEAGPTAAPPTVINALVDALSPLGIRHVEMPATPMRVWQAIREHRLPMPDDPAADRSAALTSPAQEITVCDHK